MTSVLVVQHTAVCPPGRVGAQLERDGFELEVVHCYAGDPLPVTLEPYAGLVVLGGEMGAHDDELHPWLGPTKELLRRAVATEVPTLAICLGLQLLAVAAGGRVEASPTGPQIGVRTLELTPAGRADPLLGGTGSAPPAAGVHWNNDLVVEVPNGATVLSTSAGTVQSLRLGPAVWGVQFHPEVDPATLRLWAEADVTAGVLGRDVAEQRLAEVTARDALLAGAGRRLASRFAGVMSRRA